VDSESHERDRAGRLRVFLNNSVGFVADGKLVRWWGTQRDVTERRLLEEQLRQAQKMEAVGRLAGGIAHDFNNILTAILGTSDLMLRDLPAGHPARDDVHEVRKAALRAADLTRQLLAYSRRQVLAPKVLGLNAVLAGLGPMLRRLIGEDIELVTLLAPDVPAVRADPGQIEQVVLNLAVNARDAMPSGGRLTIETAAVTLETGRCAQLAVIDTGTGMTPDVRAHLFEPFFTTKEVGKGTGLGLATVYGIVEQSGGTIHVDTAPQRGTAVRIYFPAVAPAAPDPDNHTAPAPATPGGGAAILLVEDEEAVRTFARRALEAAGYQVHLAASGREALDRVAALPDPPRLLVTDVVMPGMDGRALAAQLATLVPGLRILFTSGYTDDPLARQDLGDQGTAFLQKPFNTETLLERVRQVLARPAASSAPR
jgi:signal transduction histidine kinase/ActR/RegA family two-component response regulator